MRPIPWILAAVVFTAIGILFTEKGRTSRVPERVLLTPWEHAIVAQFPDGVPGPGSVGPGGGAAFTTVAVPKKSTPPVIRETVVVVPRASLRLLVVSGPNVKLSLSHPPRTAADSPQAAYASFTLETLETELKGLREEAAAAEEPFRPELCLVLDADARWEETLRPLLDICARAGFPGVLLGALPAKDATHLSAMPYRFFSRDGKLVATLPAREADRDDGGVIELRVSGYDTFFRYRGKNQKRVSAFGEDIRALHTELAGFEGARYADSGRNWTIRAATRAGYDGLMQAAILLRKAGIPRFGIEIE